MRRVMRLTLAVDACLALLAGATPVAASSGSDFAASVVQHATGEVGFSGDLNPGMHQGFAGWSSCPGA